MIQMSRDAAEERMLVSFNTLRVVASNLEDYDEDGINTLQGSIDMDGALWIPDFAIRDWNPEAGIAEFIVFTLGEDSPPNAIKNVLDGDSESVQYRVISVVKKGGVSIGGGAIDAWTYAARIRADVVVTKNSRNEQ